MEHEIDTLLQNRETTAHFVKKGNYRFVKRSQNKREFYQNRAKQPCILSKEDKLIANCTKRKKELP